MKGGGVSLFISDILNFKVRCELIVLNDTMEALFIEFDKSQIRSSKNVVVGIFLYRPPNTDITRFTEQLILVYIETRKQNSVLNG